MTPEGDIKKSICDYLAYRSDLRFWVQESQGTYDPNAGKFRKKKSKYQMNGISDIIVLMKYSNLPPFFVGLEVKAKSKQTESQIAFQKLIQEIGGLYFVVHSVEESIESLNHAAKIVGDEIARLVSNRSK